MMYNILLLIIAFPFILVIFSFFFYHIRWHQNEKSSAVKEKGLPDFLYKNFYFKKSFWWFLIFTFVICILLMFFSYFKCLKQLPEGFFLCLCLLILRFSYTNSLRLLDFYLTEYGNEYHWIDGYKRKEKFRLITAEWQKKTYHSLFMMLSKLRSQTGDLSLILDYLKKWGNENADSITKKMIKNFFDNEPMYKHISYERSEKFGPLDLLNDMLNNLSSFDIFANRMMYYWILKLRHSDLRWLKIVIHPLFQFIVTTLVGSCFYIYLFKDNHFYLSGIFQAIIFGLITNIGFATVLFATILYSQKGSAILIERIIDLKDDLLIQKIRNHAIFNVLIVFFIYGIGSFLLFHNENTIKPRNIQIFILSFVTSITAFSIFIYSLYSAHRIAFNTKVIHKKKLQEVLSKYNMDNPFYYIIMDYIIKVDSVEEWFLGTRIILSFFIPQLLALLQVVVGLAK